MLLKKGNTSCQLSFFHKSFPQSRSKIRLNGQLGSTGFSACVEKSFPLNEKWTSTSSDKFDVLDFHDTAGTKGASCVRIQTETSRIKIPFSKFHGWFPSASNRFAVCARNAGSITTPYGKILHMQSLWIIVSCLLVCSVCSINCAGNYSGSRWTAKCVQTRWSRL